MKCRKVLIISIIVICCYTIFSITNVNAAIQSNGNTPTTKNRNTWMTQIRQMESTGGGFGLDETINTDLTPSSTSNNIDVHMQKNTEYGAMALLSASSYGNPTKIGNGETTTGNETGVVMPYNWEWTAAQAIDYLGRTSYNDRYINYYNYQQNANYSLRGDALLETKGWHSTTYVFQGATQVAHHDYVRTTSVYGNWDNSTGYTSSGGVIRNNGNGIFSFHNKGTEYYQGEDFRGWSIGYVDYYATRELEATLSRTYTSRFAVVNGEGL